MRGTAAWLMLLVGLTACAAEDSTGDKPEATTRETARSPYEDGTYTATGTYGGLPSSIGVTLTLDDGVVTDVAVETRASDPTSLDFQRRFARAVPRVVVGRPIDELEVSRIAGASGTPEGFNDALERIRAEARR